MDKIFMANRRMRPIAFIALAIAITIAMAACSDSGNADAISGIEASVSAQSAEIEALSAQIGDLQAELADSQKMEADEVAELRSGIEELRGQDMMAAEFDDSALKSDIGDIRSMVAELQSRMDEDDDDDERIDSSHLDSLDAQLMGLGDTLAELKASMSGDEGAMDELAMEIGTLRTDVMALRDESVSMEVSDLLARLDWLESALGPAYTQAYVEQAIRRYNADGRQSTLDYYNTMDSVSGDLYLFVLDGNYELIVHPTVPTNIGMDIRGPLGTDITGKNYGSEFVTVDEQGKWVDYVYLNPADDLDYERKHSWIVRHDGLIFGSGWYERDVSLDSTPPAYARALVEQAVARYDANGREAMLAHYNDPASVDGQYYVFVVDTADLRSIANGARPDFVGTIPDRIDPTGYDYGKDIVDATGEGGWISYVILNPDTGEQQRKHSWITLHDGLVFGSGWYEPVIAARDDPPAYTQALVEQAIARYESDGHDATIEYYNSPESIDGQWYVFIGDENDVMLAHAAVPANVGLHFDEVISPDGYPAGAQAAAASVEGGAWTTYTYLNAATGNVEMKHSWVTRHNGMIFGSGWYEEGPAKSDPAAYTRAFVQRAINLYDDLGRDGTVAYYNSAESMDGQWYVFIGDENDVMIAHAAVPANVGLHFDEVISPTDSYPAGAQVAAAAIDGGAWTTYTYLNAATGNVETKHSWVMRHNGMIFGSGWYEEGAPKSDAAAYTKAFVQRAINLYNDLGHEGVIAYYNMPESVDGQWYVFIVDSDDLFLSHAPSPSLLGTDLKDVVGSDGYELGKEIAKATEDGHWVEYLWPNPATNTEETKRSWVIRHDGLVFGSGYYGESGN